MPNYQLNTGTKQQLLGTFDTIEAVKKLRIFKDRPSLLNYLQEVPPTPTAPRTTRTKRKYTAKTAEGKRIARELRQCEYIINNLLPVKQVLVNTERAAKRLMNSDPDCGMHKIETDYWVSVSNGLEDILKAVAKARLRKEQLLKLSRDKT